MKYALYVALFICLMVNPGFTQEENEPLKQEATNESNTLSQSARSLANCLDQGDDKLSCLAANKSLTQKTEIEQSIDLSNITFDASIGVPLLESSEDHIEAPIISTAVVELPDNKGKINAVDIVIEFAFDDWKILESEKLKIDQLADALNSKLLSAQKFVLLGHTDGKGTKEYNCSLSKARAQSVKSALILAGVAPSNLVAMGAGEYLLKNKRTPEAKENRRVGFIKQTPANTSLIDQIDKLCVF